MFKRFLILFACVFSLVSYGQVLDTNVCPECLTTSNAVAITWDAYDFVDNTNVTSFNIYIGGQSKTYTNFVSVGLGNSNTLSGLVSGTTYYFSVTAVSSTGLESDFSREVSYTIPYNIRAFMLHLDKVRSNVYRITAKVCPSQSMAIEYVNSIGDGWMILTNTTSDIYGNILVDDVSTNAPRFYRASLKP